MIYPSSKSMIFTSQKGKEKKVEWPDLAKSSGYTIIRLVAPAAPPEKQNISAALDTGQLQRDPKL